MFRQENAFSDGGLPSRVTVVIVHYNGAARLERCLRSVLQSRYANVGIIVVDNCSPDHSGLHVSALFPEVKFVFSDRNRGYAAGCNTGAAHADGDYLVFLNNDTTVHPDWLTHLVSRMKASNLLVATPKIVVPGEPRIINAAGGCHDIFGTAWTRGNGEVDHGQYDVEDRVFFGSACLAVQQAAWRDVGPYDERYFMYVEDVDWCWRAISRGHDVLYVPTSLVFHEWSAPGRRDARIIGLIERNSLRSLLKNHDAPLVLVALPIAYLFRFLRALVFLGRRPDISRAIARSIGWNIQHLGDTWHARGELSASPQSKGSNPVNHMSKLPFETLLIFRKITHPHQTLLSSGDAEPSPSFARGE